MVINLFRLAGGWRSPNCMYTIIHIFRLICRLNNTPFPMGTHNLNIITFVVCHPTGYVSACNSYFQYTINVTPSIPKYAIQQKLNHFASGRNSDSTTRIIYHAIVMSMLDNQSHLGLVVGGSLDRGLDIKLDKSSNLEEIKVGTYVTIHGTERRFLGMITDVRLEMIDQSLSQIPPDMSNSLIESSLSGTTFFGQC